LHVPILVEFTEAEKVLIKKDVTHTRSEVVHDVTSFLFFSRACFAFSSACLSSTLSSLVQDEESISKRQQAENEENKEVL